MKLKTVIKRMLVAVGVVTSLLILTISVVVISGMTIRLDYLRPAIEKGATEVLGRTVSIEGAIELIPSLRPTVSVSGVKISNPSDWSEKQFVSVALARTQVDIPDLLAREISIGEITAEGIAFYLVSDAQGRNNWVITADEENRGTEKNTTDTERAPTATDVSPEERRIRFTSLDDLSLSNIVVNYRDSVMNKTIEFKIDEFSGSAKAGEAVQFNLSGSLQEHKYQFRVDSGSLEDLRDRETSWPLVLSGKIAGITVDASGELDRKADEPRLHLGFSLGRVDIGAVLAKLNIVDGLNASTQRIALNATLVGDSLHELIARSEVGVTLEGGQWILQDPNTGAKLPIEILDGSIMAMPEQPITLKVNGIIDQTPIIFSIAGMSLVDLASQPKAMRLHIDAEAAGAKLTLEGELALPVRSRDASLAITFSGETLDSMEALIPVDLPPFGPYLLNARFAVVKSGYELSKLHLEVGDSQLDGSIQLDTSGSKPRTDIRLSSKRLQLNDFSTAGWSPETRLSDLNGPALAKVEEIQASNGKPAAGLLSPKVLNAFDAKLNVEVVQVLSGKDNLGGGMLGIAVENGKLSMDPLQLDVPSGSVKVGFAYHPTPNDATVHLNAHIDQFDIGILVRRIDPERTLGGLLSLDVALDGTAPDLKHLLVNTSGHVDFAFRPENLAVGIVDLWAVNVITVMSQQVDDEPDSTLNCMVAQFILEEGVMQEKTIFMDTTRMSISADATIDFKEETVEILAVPKAKQPEYFSLATPVKVHGSFSDFGIGVNKLSIAKTAVSFITSPITVTLKRLFSGKLPADGQVACEEAWRMKASDD